MQSIRPDASADCVRSLTRSGQDVQSDNMRAVELVTALQKLSEAIVEVETAVAALNANQDPLASHIFTSRRHFRAVHGTR